MKQLAISWTVVLAACAVGCGGDGDGEEGPPACDPANVPTFEEGGEGHADPLGVGPGEVRAGRISGDALPQIERDTLDWEDGDFVLANEHVAMVIEDVGPSESYDPWGGRPLGVAKVEDGALAQPGDWGELMILTGRFTTVTRSVTVLNDGSDGNPAVIRAIGKLAPVPALDTIAGGLLTTDFSDIEAAIDYTLAPGAQYVDVTVSYASSRVAPVIAPSVPHVVLFTSRLPMFAPDKGFVSDGKGGDYFALIDEAGTSIAYGVPGQILDAGLSFSGVTFTLTEGFSVEACGLTERTHARMYIGGPGIDGLRQVVAADTNEALRAITGTVTNSDGTPAEGVRVHAETTLGAYVTRAFTDTNGDFSLHVGVDDAVNLTAWRRGDGVPPPALVPATMDAANIELPQRGWIHVTIEDEGSGTAIPARVQIVGGDTIPEVPDYYGEYQVVNDRLDVDYAMTGDTTLSVPAGTWNVIVSRGFEYEVFEQQVVVTEGSTALVAASLEQTVDTPNVMCADFHIHTLRSPDSGDDAREKVMSAISDGLEIPVRTDHEYVNGFQQVIESMGLDEWAFGVNGVEITTLQVWGHANAFPVNPDPSKLNNGTPQWVTYPTAENPDQPLEITPAPVVFDAVRARPEKPVVIINHPRGGDPYFTYAGYDPITGVAANDELWDENFKLVEVFNNSGWNANRDDTVVDWLSFLDRGRRVFAVGSSDSHGISYSPVGYPRTCLEVGVNSPTQLTPSLVRDTAAAGHSVISGGIYIEADIDGMGPGDTVSQSGTSATLNLRVRAPSWIDATTIEIIVDGETVDTIDIEGAAGPIVRYQGTIDLTVAPAAGSYVIVAAWGNDTLEPVHPGRRPFGVTNPIFIEAP